MITIYLEDFLQDGMLKEKFFRQKIDELNWDDFQDKRVLIKGCSEAPIPTWAYLIITAHLSQKAKRIYFGELRQAIKIFNRDK